MRYLIVSGDFVTTGGMDRANHAFVSHSAETGHDVDVIAHRADPGLADNPKVTVHLARRPFGSHTMGMPFLARAARARASALPPETLVLANGGNCTVGEVCWVHYLHAAYAPARTRRAAFLHGMHVRREHAALRRARVVIANSKATARMVTALHGIPADRIEVVYYGIDSTTFQRADAAARDRMRVREGVGAEQRIVLFVGALDDGRKGSDILLRAWQEAAADEAWSATLLLVGDDRARNATTRQLDKMGIRNSVRILGFRNDMETLIPAADLLVAPSLYEPYGLAVHEALCAGVPAVVSENAGIAERYPTALEHLLIPRQDPHTALVGMLRAWHADPDAWRVAVAPFTARLRRRSWAHMASDMVFLMDRQRERGAPYAQA